MELDEMKRRMQERPVPPDLNDTNDPAGLQRLMDAVRAEDAREMRLRRRTRIFFLAAGIFYSGLLGLTAFAPPDDPTGDARFVLGLFGGVSLAIGYREHRRMRRIAAADPTMPALAFLDTLAPRYIFDWTAESVLAVLLAAGVGMGLVRGIERYILGSMVPDRWLVIGAIALAGALIGLFLSRSLWRRDKGAILRDIEAMRGRLAGPEER